MTRTINFDCRSSEIADAPNIRFAVTPPTGSDGSRTFILLDTADAPRDISPNFELKANVKALNEVDQVRVKSLQGLNEFKQTVELVNRKVEKHNNNGLKTILLCLGIPWLIATLFDSDFFKKFDKTKNKDDFEISIDFSEVNTDHEFNAIMDKIEESTENIVELDFSHHKLTPDNVTRLAKALRLNTTIHSLVLSQPDGKLAADELQKICSAVKENPNSGINNLSFRGVSMTGQNMVELKGLLSMKNRITHLDFTDTALTAADAKVLQEALSKNQGLKTLNLYWNYLYSDGAECVASILNDNPKMTELNIGGNNIKTDVAGTFSTSTKLDGVTALANAIKIHPGLTTVDLRRNYLDNEGCIPFAKALQNGHLTWFDISWNRMGDKAAHEFGTAINNNNGLQHISFFWNNINPVGISAIAKGIRNNRTLGYIDIGSNNLNQEGKDRAKRDLETAVQASPVPRRIRYSSAATTAGRYLNAFATLVAQTADNYAKAAEDDLKARLSWEKDEQYFTN